MKGSRRKKRKQRAKQPVAGASPSPEKQPHSRFHPEARKIPTVEEQRDFMRLHPRWRFSLLELQGAYGWARLQGQAIRGLRDRLAELEKSTWAEIFVRDRHQNHSVDRDKLSTDAQKKLRKRKLDDFERFWSLRITAKERVWGLLVEDVFYLLWWDPEHEVCPSHLKHT